MCLLLKNTRRVRRTHLAGSCNQSEKCLVMFGLHWQPEIELVWKTGNGKHTSIGKNNYHHYYLQLSMKMSDFRKQEQEKFLRFNEYAIQDPF